MMIIIKGEYWPSCSGGEQGEESKGGENSGAGGEWAEGGSGAEGRRVGGVTVYPLGLLLS